MLVKFLYFKPTAAGYIQKTVQEPLLLLLRSVQKLERSIQTRTRVHLSPTTTSPPASLCTPLPHEKTFMPPLMAVALFISPANLSSFSFRNRGARGWRESARSIKYEEEAGQWCRGIKRGRGSGNEGRCRGWLGERTWRKEKRTGLCDGWTALL